MNSITIWFIQNILNQATRNLNWKIKVILLHEIPRWSVRKYNFWVDDNEVLESINGIQKNSKKMPTPFLWKGILIDFTLILILLVLIYSDHINLCKLAPLRIGHSFLMNYCFRKTLYRDFKGKIWIKEVFWAAVGGRKNGVLRSKFGQMWLSWGGGVGVRPN